jgi:copper chaperone
MRSYLRWGTLASVIVAAGLVAANQASQNAQTGAIAPAKAAIAASATKTTVLNISGMNCGGCVASVGEVLNRIEGVQDVVASPEKQEATITYDPARTSPEALAKALTEDKITSEFKVTVKSS